MEIYRLSKLGYNLSHSTRNPSTPEWAVIHYLGRMHVASRDKILGEVPGASTLTLAKLSRMRPPVLVKEAGVSV